MTGWYFHLAGYHELASQANCFVSPSTASEYSHDIVRHTVCGNR